MAKFTLPTRKQVEEKRERLFQKINISANITDYYSLLGGTISEDDDYYINALGIRIYYEEDETDDTKEPEGIYWLKDVRTGYKYDGPCVKHDSQIGNGHKDEYDIGCRPMTKYSQIKSKCYDETINRGLTRVTYGEYPQTAVDEDTKKVLEKSFNEILSGESINFTVHLSLFS